MWSIVLGIPPGLILSFVNNLRKASFPTQNKIDKPTLVLVEYQVLLMTHSSFACSPGECSVGWVIWICVCAILGGIPCIGMVLKAPLIPIWMSSSRGSYAPCLGGFKHHLGSLKQLKLSSPW